MRAISRIKSFISNEHKKHILFKGILYEQEFVKAFLRKYPQKELLKNDINEIQNYWKQYGIIWKDLCWFQMYYGVTKIKDPRFLPHNFFKYVLLPYYNESSYCDGWDEKNLYEILCSSIRWPKVYCRHMKNNLYDCAYNHICNDNKINLESIESLISEYPCEVILKKSSNTAVGKGVKLYKLANRKDTLNMLIENFSFDFIVQERLVQHTIMNQLCSSSVNIIRIMTWRDNNGEIKVFPACIRHGIEGYFTDMAFIDGIEVGNIIAIDDKGRLGGPLVGFNGRDIKEHFMSGTHIPNWNIVIKQVKEGHRCIFFHDIVAWDIAIDVNGKPVCIEYNIKEPGTILYQFASGPYAAENTDNILSFLRNKENQQKYLPKFFKR